LIYVNQINAQVKKFKDKSLSSDKDSIRNVKDSNEEVAEEV